MSMGVEQGEQDSVRNDVRDDLTTLEQMMAVEVPAGPDAARSDEPRADRLARELSAVMQPAVSIPGGYALIGLVLGSPDRLRWALLVPLLMAVVPVGAVLLLRATGRIRTLRLTGRPRVVLLSLGACYQLGALAALSVLGAPAMLCTTLGGGLIALFLLVLLHLATHASVHTSALSLVAGMLLPTVPVLAGFIAVLAALAGWSRVRIGAHTRVQAWLLPALVGAVAALAVATALTT